MPPEKLSAAHSVLVEKLLSLGISRVMILAALAKWGEYALQTLIYLLSGTVPPIPTPLQAKAGAGCCDHAACCCAINEQLAKAIEAGCCHGQEGCDHCQCAEQVACHAGQAYCLALQHYAACQGASCDAK